MTAPRTCFTAACQLTADFNGSNNLALAFRQKYVDLPRDGGGPAQQNPQAHEQSEPGTIAWVRMACVLLILSVFPLARALPVPSAPRPRSWASALRWVGPGAFTFLTTAFCHAPRALYESSPDTQTLALSTPLLSSVPLDLVFFFCAAVCTSLAVHASAYCSINPLPSNSYPARRAFLTKHGHYAYSWHHFFPLFSSLLRAAASGSSIGTPWMHAASPRSGRVGFSLLALLFACVGCSEATAPAVYELQPTAGPAAGGTLLTVTGNNLVGTDVFCKFGTAVLVAPIMLSTTQMVCDTPSHAAARVFIEVTTDGGLTYSQNSIVYLYSGLEIVTTISPSRGPDFGSTAVRVSGRGFRNFPSLSCMFGVTAVSAQWLSSDAVQCVTPPKNAGLEVSVRVANNGVDFSTSYGVFLVTGM